MQYKFVNDSNGNLKLDQISKIDDLGTQSCIPNDPANRDWQQYQKWLSQGNQPLKATN